MRTKRESLAQQIKRSYIWSLSGVAVMFLGAFGGDYFLGNLAYGLIGIPIILGGAISISTLVRCPNCKKRLGMFANAIHCGRKSTRRINYCPFRGVALDDHPCCAKCGYDLRGSGEACPECGTLRGDVPGDAESSAR